MMKKIIPLLLSVAMLVCMPTVGAEAKETDFSGNIYEERFIHYLYGELADEPGFESDYEAYEEVYFHYAQDETPD